MNDNTCIMFVTVVVLFPLSLMSSHKVTSSTKCVQLMLNIFIDIGNDITSMLLTQALLGCDDDVPAGKTPEFDVGFSPEVC